MKNICHRSFCLLLFSLPGLFCFSQDSLKKELLVDLGYYMPANRVPYLEAYTKMKIDKRFQSVPEVQLSVYLDSIPNLMGKVQTDQTGKARIIIPASMKASWNESPRHTFIAVAESTNQFDEVTSEIVIAKSKVEIDTVAAEEGRTVRVRVFELSGDEWIPAKDVEMKIGVSRIGGILPISDEETYTTDSTGEVVAEFKKENLPGDSAGNIRLIARVEDNEQLGNLQAEAIVPWGEAFRVVPEVQHRSLWATRDKAPLWLLFMAGVIVVIVWGSIIYLIIQIFKIRRLGLRVQH